MELQSKSSASSNKKTNVYYAHMSYNNGTEGFQFPVNPSSVEVNETGQGKTYNVPGIGEINVIGSKSLSEISFNGLFPAQYYPFVNVKEDDLRQPVQYILRVNKWMRTKHPVRFILSSETYNINTPATIESFTWNEAAGGNGDIEYSIKLKQYMFYRARKLKSGLTSQASKGVARADEKQQPKTYKLVKNDTLWKVAQMHLGNGARWKEIQKLNGITDAEITRLQVGRVLKLP